MRNFIVLAGLALLLINVVDAVAKDDGFEVEAEGRYRLESGASIDLAKKVALFAAKRKAIELAGRYLSRKSLIEVYELDKDEIYSLAAREVRAKILSENVEISPSKRTYRVRIRARIQSYDFIKAEMEDTRQEKKEAETSYREEMEQPVSPDIDPGGDIAKAYRLLREKKWRIAAIYLNHLEKKYPNWDDIYMAQAITHFINHNPVFMKKALNKACGLGNQVACDELLNFKRVHEFDFSLKNND